VDNAVDRLAARFLAHGAQLRGAGVEQFAADGRAQQQGRPRRYRRDPRRPQDRHQYGARQNRRAQLADDRNVDQCGDDDHAGDEQEAHALQRPGQQVDQVPVAFRLPQDVGEAQRAADRHQELLAGEIGQERPDYYLGMASDGPQGQGRQEQGQAHLGPPQDGEHGEADHQQADRQLHVLFLIFPFAALSRQ
jgi:hypothetical protein